MFHSYVITIYTGFFFFFVWIIIYYLHDMLGPY